MTLSRIPRLLPVVLLGMTLCACAEPCGNQLILRVPSPDRVHDAVIYERDCGATTDFSTQVTLLRAGAELPHDPSPILVIDSDHGRAVAGPGGGPLVEATWVSSDSLVVSFDEHARVFQHLSQFSNIGIRYVRSRRGGA